MRSLSCCGFIFFTILASLSGAGPVAAGEYRDAVHHFRVEIPPGWRAMTEAEWKAFVESTKDTLVEGKPIAWVAGFYPEKGENTQTKIVVSARQAVWTRFDTRDKVQLDFGQGIGLPVVKSEGDFASLVHRAGDTQAVLDWGRNRLIFGKTLEPVPGSKVRYSSALQMCKAGTINIYCYSAPGTFEKDLPAFQILNDSFVLDAGSEFKPPENDAAFRIGYVMGTLICLALPVLLIVVLVVVLTRRKDQRNTRGRRRRRRDEDYDDEE